MNEKLVDNNDGTFTSYPIDKVPKNNIIWMPVTDYAKCIMALQKVEDIRRISNVTISSEQTAVGLVKAIRAIANDEQKQ